MLSPPHKSRRPSRSPRESPRAQLQNELPSRDPYKSVHYPKTAMHVKGADKQADVRISTPGITQAVRGNSELPVRAWGAASTLPPALQSVQWVLQRRHSRSRPVDNLPAESAVEKMPKSIQDVLLVPGATTGTSTSDESAKITIDEKQTSR